MALYILITTFFNILVTLTVTLYFYEKGYRQGFDIAIKYKRMSEIDKE